MIFSSTLFIFIFLPLVLLIYYFPTFKNNRKYKNSVLLFASLLFYAWGEPVYIFLMLISIIITYFMGCAMGGVPRQWKKLMLTVGIIYHVSILFVFKYLSFVCQEICGLSHGLIDIQPVNIVLPIGISFYTFQMMSYLFDVYYGHADVQQNFFDLALYVALFPQLIAGPIVRYETIEKEIYDRKESIENVQNGLKRFVIGLGKKALLADFLAIVVDNTFALMNTESLSMLSAWVGAIAYTLQIFFDFSGYSDMAIGLGQCFGFRFKENFSEPYLAESVNDFWKRWHISLTDWFRDYLYIPLGGNRVRKERHILNIIIVWTCTGMWHGANWTFLFWGLFYCVLQLAEKYCYNVKRWPVVLRHMYTMFTVCIAWVIFRSDNISSALEYIISMFGKNGIVDETGIYYFENSIVSIIIAILLCLPWRKWIKSERLSSGVMIIKECGMYCFIGLILIMVVSLSISGGYSPFIYFNF